MIVAVDRRLISTTHIPLVVLSLMPAIMFVANKSASLVMVISALVALLAKPRDGGGKPALGSAKDWLRSRRSRMVGLALGVAFLSASQSPETIRSFVVAASLLQLTAIAAAHSGAAAFGVIGFVGGVLACRLLGARSAKAALLMWVAGCLLVAPVIGTVLAPFRDGRIVAHLQGFHLKERIEIWNAFDIALRDKPIVGYGFGASQEVIEAVAQKRGFDQAMDVARNIHPHNGYLQVWVEMGLVGAVLALAAVILSVGLLNSRSVAFTSRFGIWSFCCVLMLLSHSLWQTWWIASIGAAATWLRVDEMDRPGDGATP